MSIKNDNSGARAHFASAEIITSRQNPTVAMTAGLSDKKRREAAGLFLLDGIKLTLEALSSELAVRYVLLTERAAGKYASALEPLIGSARVCILSEPAFDRVTDERAPEGVVAVAAYSDTVRRDFAPEDADAGDSRLILDGVQNPENFGAILRSARAFGTGNIICGDGCADVYGRRVMRASMGAALHTGTLYTRDAAGVCGELAARGHRVIATVPREGATPLSGFKFRRGDCIVIGNEGHGISREVSAAATDAVYIPMAPGQESLNAASAAAIILWELYKSQR